MAQNERVRSRGKVTAPVSTGAGHNATSSEEGEIEIDLLELMYVLLEKLKWIVLVAVLIASMVGVYDFFIARPTYQATSKLYVLNSKDSAISLSDLQIGSQLTSDYMEVFSNWHVHEMVIRRLGLDCTYDEISSHVKVTNPSSTRILYITCTAYTPQEAKDMADTYAQVAQEFIAEKMETEEPNIFQEALLPTSPASPHKVRDIALGFGGGALLAIAFFIIRFLADDRIHSADDVEKKLGMPVLGMMPVQDGKDHSADKPGSDSHHHHHHSDSHSGKGDAK